MKNIFLFAMLFFSTSAFTQNTTDYDEISLEKATDYQVAEPSVLTAATYLLSTPFSSKDIQRTKSLRFVIKWMSGTPDYSFELDESVLKITKGNDDFLGLYMAGMTKYCLENKNQANDKKLVKINAVILLIKYCSDEINNIKPTKQLKKLIEANEKGELEKELS